MSYKRKIRLNNKGRWTYDDYPRKNWADSAAHGKNDFLQAVNLSIPFVQKGGISAQSILGMMYAKGESVAQNYAEAVK